MFHTERSWHTYRLTVVIVFWSAGFALWCKRIFFDLFWSVKLFYYGWINSSELICEEKITNFKAHLLQRGFPEDLINTTLSEVNFKDRKLALQQKPKTNQRILPFVTQYQPSVPNLKQILMKNWHLIEQQPLLSEIYKKPPLVSYKRGRSLKDILVRAKL